MKQLIIALSIDFFFEVKLRVKKVFILQKKKTTGDIRQ